MLDHIEHRDQPILFARLKGLVERLDADPGRPPSAGIDERRVRLDAFDVAELGEPIEEQAIAAADVEDRSPARRRRQRPERRDDHVLTRPPPPMPPVQIAVSVRVLGFHLSLQPPNAAGLRRRFGPAPPPAFGPSNARALTRASGGRCDRSRSADGA